MVAEPFRKRWTGDEPVGFDPSALCQMPGCSWESKRSPKPLHSVRITAPAPRQNGSCRGRGGRQATALLTRQASETGRDWVRLPGPLPSLSVKSFECQADTVGRACL